MSSPRVVVIGSLNLDLCVHIDHLPSAGETIGSATLTRAPGGKGANQAVACARLGCSTHLLGALGDDDAATLVRTTLHESGVDLSALIKVTEPTGTAVILLTPSGENSIVVAPGANYALSSDHVQRYAPLLRQAGMLLTQLETPLPVLAAVLELAGQSGIPVMLDPAPAMPLPRELLQQLTWFTPNETEAAFYARHFQLPAPPHADTEDSAAQTEDLCRQFQSLGPANILLKLGRRGAAALCADGTFARLPAASVRVVDTTGAGDICNAAFATALLRQLPIRDALHFAITAASISVGRAGAMPSAPTLSEVEEGPRQSGSQVIPMQKQ
jgi:ribokinase